MLRVEITKEEVIRLGYSFKQVIRTGNVDMCGICVAHQLGKPGMGCTDHLKWDGRPCYDEVKGQLPVKHVVAYGVHRGIATLDEYIKLKQTLAEAHS